MWYNLLNSAQTAQEKRKGYSMKIVLVGGGKVGTALARQLSEEGHNVTVIDTNKARVEHIGESYDVMSILGNGSSIITPVPYTHLRAHETSLHLVCRLLLEKNTSPSAAHRDRLQTSRLPLARS